MRGFVSHRSFTALFTLSNESKKFEKSLDSRPPRRGVLFPTPPERANVFTEKEKRTDVFEDQSAAQRDRYRACRQLQCPRLRTECR
ncbi:hypothetical protein D3C71_1748530 [compost metagenome]